MIIRVPIEVTVEGRNALKSTTGELETLEKTAKRASTAAHDVGKGFASGTTRATEFADATGRVSTKLARSVETLGLSAAGFRQLDDVMDIAELGFAGLTKAAAGFNAASIGVAGAGLAIGMAIGSWLNTFPAVQKAADSLLHSMFRFVGLAPEITASAGPIAEFSKKMGASNMEALTKQVAQMRGAGTSDKDIAKFYGDTLTTSMAKQLGLSKEQLKVSEAQAKADEKRKNEIQSLINLFKGEKSLTELYKASMQPGTAGLMMPGIATSLSSYEGRSTSVSAKGADVLGSLMGGGMATSLNLSWSKEQALNQKAAAEATKLADEKTQKLIGTFGVLSGQLQNLSQTVGGFAGKLLGIAASLSSGAGGVMSGIKGWKDSSDVGGIMGKLGKLSAGLGIVGSAIGAVGGLIGGIKSLFGGKSKEEKAAEAAAVKQAEADKKAAVEEAARLKVEGLEKARSAAESLMDRMGKGGMSEALTGALGALIGKVQDALLKSGAGYMATGALRESADFQGAQGASKDVANLVAGMRQGGALDTGLMKAAGEAAVELQGQAVAAAQAAGLIGAEAVKAGFAAIAPLLTEQLNASLASGQALDENTKQLIEEAKANGVLILADPMVESVAVQKQMLGELRGINGSGRSSSQDSYVGPPDTAWASGTRGMRVVKRNMVARIHAGEGMIVIPRDEMGRTAFRGFARGTDDPYEGRGWDVGARQWVGADTTTAGDMASSGGGGTSYTATVAAVQSAMAPVIAAVAAIASAPQISVPVNYAPNVVVRDESVVQTPESVRAFNNLVVGSLQASLEQNSRGVRASVKQVITETLRENGLI